MNLQTAALGESVDMVVPGHGFYREKILPLRDFHLDADGATLTTTTSTNPGWTKVGTNMTGLAWAASKQVACGYDFAVPDDYDALKDKLIVKLKLKMAGATDTPTVTVAAYSDAASTTDLAPTALTALSATATWKEIDLSDNSIAAGDVIHFNLTPEAAHTTDAIELYGIKLKYKSDLAAHLRTSRS